MHCVCVCVEEGGGDEQTRLGTTTIRILYAISTSSKFQGGA